MGIVIEEAGKGVNLPNWMQAEVLRLADRIGISPLDCLKVLIADALDRRNQ